MDDDDDGVSLQKSYSKKRDPGGDVRSYRFSLDTMNNSVAEAARRIFGHLPHSTCRTGTKYLRKNSIGIKIAAYYPEGKVKGKSITQLAEMGDPQLYMDERKEWKLWKREDNLLKGKTATKKGEGKRSSRK